MFVEASRRVCFHGLYLVVFKKKPKGELGEVLFRGDMSHARWRHSCEPRPLCTSGRASISTRLMLHSLDLRTVVAVHPSQLVQGFVQHLWWCRA